MGRGEGNGAMALLTLDLPPPLVSPPLDSLSLDSFAFGFFCLWFLCLWILCLWFSLPLDSLPLVSLSLDSLPLDSLPLVSLAFGFSVFGFSCLWFLLSLVGAARSPTCGACMDSKKRLHAPALHGCIHAYRITPRGHEFFCPRARAGVESSGGLSVKKHKHCLVSRRESVDRRR